MAHSTDDSRAGSKLLVDTAGHGWRICDPFDIVRFQTSLWAVLAVGDGRCNPESEDGGASALLIFI